MLVHADGRIVGTIGGGCLEAEMTWRAREAIEGRRPRLVSYDLTPEQAGEDGLVCGGRMQVFIEPIEGTPVLCLFGAGHVAQPLARMAKACGFRVELADDRVKFANAERFPEADLIVVDDFADGGGEDDPRAELLRGRGDAGSQGRRGGPAGGARPGPAVRGPPREPAEGRAHLRRPAGAGGEAEDLAAVHAPLGLEIGAQTPEEIAVSILAEMIAVRRGVDPAQSRSMKMELPGPAGPRPKLGQVLK